MPSDEVMHKFGAGQLRSGKRGPVVRDRKQAIAIAASEHDKEKDNGGKYPEKSGAMQLAYQKKRG